ncbi:50S ribosomal protein L13 [Patescibacteria group bacterium]
MKYTIDAKDKKIGRVASEAASVLLGKDKPTFKKNIVSDIKVVIDNVSGLDISQKKMDSKKYQRYSGYPGGLKEETAGKVIEKKGYGELVKKAVYGMLPGNKLRALRMKNLIIK